MKPSIFAQPAACAGRRCLDVGRYRRVRRYQELRVQTRRTDRQGRSRQNHRREARRKRRRASLFRTRSFSPRASTWLRMPCRRWPPRSPRSRERNPAPTGSRPPSAWPAGGNCHSAPKVQGETGTVENKLVIRGRQMKRSVLIATRRCRDGCSDRERPVAPISLAGQRDKARTRHGAGARRTGCCSDLLSGSGRQAHLFADAEKDA